MRDKVYIYYPRTGCNDEYKEIHDKEIGGELIAGHKNINNEPQNEPQNELMKNKASKRQEEMIKIISQDNTISKEMMAEHIGCSLSTIKRDLKELQKKGVIVSNNIRIGEKWVLK